MQKHYLLLALIAGFVLPHRALAISPIFAPTIFTDPVIADEADVNWTTGELSVGPNAGDISLRSAVIAANHNPGSGVQLSAGTYHLTIPGGITTAGTGEAYTGNPLIGDLDIKASDVTIFGAGIDQTTIVQEAPSGGSNDRVIEVNPDLIANFNFTITDLTITGGQTPDGGGGLLAGSQNNAMTIARVNFNHNAATGDGSAGGAIWFLGGGTLNITESVFSNNSTTTSSGGAIDFFANPNPGSLTITKSRFSSNTSTSGGDGGALRVAGDLSSDSLIGVCAFTQNSVGGASAQGGAISVQSSTHNLNIAFNRFYQNSAATAANGKTLASSGSTTVPANQNWWGLNTGPGANDVLGLTPASWLQLRATPTDATVPTGGTTTINADVFGLNSGGSVSSASLSGLPAFALSGTATLGSLSTAGAQFTDADATTTFTAGSKAGFATIQVTADGETATVNISIPTTVTSVARVTTSPSNLSTLEWDVTLADPVDLLVAGNFSLVPGTGLGTASINGVTPGGATPTSTWRVSANVAPGDGTLGLDMVNDTGASADVTNLPFTGEVYLVDRTPPTIQIDAPSVTITRDGPVTYNMVYVDDNFSSSSIDVGDIALNKTGTANGAVGVSVVGNQVQVTISSIVGDGTLGISIGGGTAADTAGNLADGGPSSTFIVDNTPPSVDISLPNVALTKNGPVSYAVTYSDPNFNSSILAVGDITLNSSGTASGSLGVSVLGNVATVTISSITGNGTLGISVGAGTATDTAGNASGPAGPSPTFDVDNSGPAVSISAPDQSLTCNLPVSYSITYLDPNFDVSTLTEADIALITTGTATAATVTVNVVGNEASVTLSDISGDGTIGISIGAGTARDTLGNLSLAAGPSATFEVDNTTPLITISNPTATFTATDPVSYTVTYSDVHLHDITLSSGDINLNVTGSATATTITVTGTGNTRTVELSGISGDGTLGITILSGTASDTAHNPAPAAGPSVTFIVDNTNDDPTITGTVDSQTVNDNATISPFSAVTIGDPDLPTQTLDVLVALDDPDKGAFTTLNGFTDVGFGGYQFIGTAAEATTAIQGLIFDPADNRVPPGFTETIGFLIDVEDTEAAFAQDTTTTVISTSINDPPVAGNFTITRQPGQETKISIEEILSHASDPDVDNLSLDLPGGTTANGATIATEGRWVLYLAPTDDSDDTFSYTVTDSQSATASGIITVIVQPDDAESKNILSITQDGSDYVIKFFGIPTQSYTIQATDDLRNPAWQDRGTVTAGPNGLTEFRDVNAPANSNFYRTHTP